MSETTLREVLTDPETYENVADRIPEKEEGKPYALRKLAAKDVAPMAEILTQIGFREFKDILSSPDLTAFIGSLSGDEKKSEAGIARIGAVMAFEVVGVILSNYEKCQGKLMEWLASLSGMTKKQVENLPFEVFTEMIIDVVKKEEFKGFTKVVSTLFK